MQTSNQNISNFSANDKVALSLLQEVQSKIDNILCDTIVIEFNPRNYDADLDNFCKEMIKQCELAESKSNNDEILLLSNVLKANLYGCWRKSSGVRGTHPKARECYENALKYAKNDEDESEIRYRYALFASLGFGGSKELALSNFRRVIELVGDNSDLGITCGKEIAKLEQKKSGCFIATAVYGSAYANEVIVLKDFRDKFLLKYRLGKSFVQLYYWLSPPIANVISKKYYLREFTKIILTIPLIKLVRKLNIREK